MSNKRKVAVSTNAAASSQQFGTGFQSTLPTYLPNAADAEAAETAETAEPVALAKSASPAEPLLKKIKKGGRVPGSQNFTDADKKRAFGIIRRVQPFGSNKWDIVSTEYNRLSRELDRKDRDGDFLKKYYSDRIRDGYSKPTGDPDLNWEIQEAREIKYEIDGVLHMGKLDDSESGIAIDKEGKNDELIDDNFKGLDASLTILNDDRVLPEHTLFDKSVPKLKMTVERAKRQTPGITSQASELLNKVMSTFEREETAAKGSEDVLQRALERSDIRYEKLEIRYDKLKEKLVRTQEELERMKDENHELKLQLAIWSTHNCMIQKEHN
ncbi:uncharacterized protein H6S33_002612 [Morchella sextelata]|uniref:uncharacterized protein n=1 Tax=Morchella sextelata TaxID=1174677 RepID=UPI001D053958|nr:uncharacterized protein H6S33_002612 [Morchella sextelata]KAH0607578.1 hypothetical protein H6S33_002612 [Morchella sextelata]